MAARKKTVKRKTSNTVPKKRRRPVASASRKSKRDVSRIANFVMPLILMALIVGCLGFLGLMGYRTVTASEFFDVKRERIDIRGVSRSSRDEIEKIVAGQTEMSGAWNADLNTIKERVEKLMFVKSAAVSRVLPNGVRVDVTERIPLAAVRLSSGDFLVDSEGEVLSIVSKLEEKFPFVMRGWDEGKTEKARKDNVERVKLYGKMLEEWQSYELASRVKELNLADTQDPRAVIEDSGANVSIAVGKESFGRRLKAAVEVVAGKGGQVPSVNSAGLYPVLEYPK
jgi:cell division septal protein FtsQ